MAENKTGGSAFPITYWVGSQYGPMPNDQSDGMTLRDYFAAKVITSCIQEMPTLDEAAALAYQIADGMLKAREVGK